MYFPIHLILSRLKRVDLALAAMNFVMFNFLSSMSLTNFMVFEPFTTLPPTLIFGKSYLFRNDLVPNVMKFVFLFFIFEVVLMHPGTNSFDIELMFCKNLWSIGLNTLKEK